MDIRPTPLELPDRRPFVVVGIPDMEDHHLKIPSIMTVSKVVKSLERIHIAALMSLQGKVDQAGMLGLIKEAGPELCAVLGALIGLSWSHRDKYLSTPANAADPLAYGEAVFEELHGEGYPLESLVMLGLTVIRAVYDQSEISAEVSEKASFFFPMLVRKTSNASTSESVT